MKIMWIFALIPAATCALFLISGGGFGKAANWLNSRYLSRLMLDDGSVKTALLIAFSANAAAALITLAGLMTGTAEDGYLLRPGYNDLTYTATLDVTISGEEKPVDIELAPRTYRDEEKEDILNRAAAGIEALILNGQSAGHITHDLNLPSDYEDTPVVISYITDRPDILDWDGKICENIPRDGTDITLTASLEWGDREREILIPLTVFPKELPPGESLRLKVNHAISETNNEEDEKVILPERIDGEEVVWKTPAGGQGLIVYFAGILFSLLYLFSRVQNREIEEMKKREELLYDYPHLVNKLVLLLNAGMSIRAAFEKTASDYLGALKRGGSRREGYEAVVQVCADMQNGIAETDALRRMGERSGEPKYRTFSSLLVQNLKKGGGELTSQLSREAEEAFEERKKRARIIGEQAGTKLMFPMMLMLMVVFAVLMVPAVSSF